MINILTMLHAKPPATKPKSDKPHNVVPNCLLAKLAYSSNFTMVYGSALPKQPPLVPPWNNFLKVGLMFMVAISVLTMVCKPTYNWGQHLAHLFLPVKNTIKQPPISALTAVLWSGWSGWSTSKVNSSVPHSMDWLKGRIDEMPMFSMGNVI